MGLAERKCNNTSSSPALPHVWIWPGRSRSPHIMFARSTQVMMLSSSGEKCWHEVVSAIARAMKRCLGHQLLAQQKGPRWCRWSRCSTCPKSRKKLCPCPIHTPAWGNAGRTFTLVQVLSGERTSLGLSSGVGRYRKTNPVWALSIGLCVLLRSCSCRETPDMETDVSKEHTWTKYGENCRKCNCNMEWKCNRQKIQEHWVVTDVTAAGIWGVRTVWHTWPTRPPAAAFCAFMVIQSILTLEEFTLQWYRQRLWQAVVLSPKQTHLSLEHTYPG